MMSVKIGQLDNVLQSLNVLGKKELPIRVSYKISKIIRQLSNEHEIFMQKKKEIAEKYAERDKEGNIITSEEGFIKIEKSKIDKCQKELDELVMIDFELTFEPIKLSELESVTVTPSDLAKLHKFITEDNAE